MYRPSRPTEKKVSLIFFTITFTNMQGFKKIWYTTLQWILIILLNLLHCMPCTSLTWWRNVDVTEIMPFTMLQRERERERERERRQILSLHAEMWPPNSPDLNPVDYSIWGILQERVYRSRIHDVKELKRLLMEWRLLDHTIITAAIAQWRSRLNTCVRVNGGHFEHKCWASDFLLCSVNVTDINMCKVLILCVMLHFCVWHFHTVW